MVQNKSVGAKTTKAGMAPLIRGLFSKLKSSKKETSRNVAAAMLGCFPFVGRSCKLNMSCFLNAANRKYRLNIMFKANPAQNTQILQFKNSIVILNDIALLFN